jgi:hypothetical protein
MRTHTVARTPARPRRPRSLRRVAPALGLFLLSPLVAEWLLGNQSITQLASLFVLAPMYGGGALLIREVARRTGQGWPAIVLLALAYGLLEEGLLTQMLFSPTYHGWAMPRDAFLPLLGVDGYLTVTVLAMHTVWSIIVPIALVEALVPGRAAAPWLGRTGLTVTGVVFLMGAGLAYYVEEVAGQHHASAAQRIGTVVAVVALAAAALAVARRPRPRSHRRPPSPWLVGAVSLAASSLYFLAPGYVPAWVGVGIDLGLAAAVAALIVGWSRRAGWGGVHRLALAAGATLTYAWLGFTQAPLDGAPGTVHRLGNALFTLAAVALLVTAARTVRRARPAYGASRTKVDWNRAAR